MPGGVHDKPFQGRLLGRTAFGGYAEAHARYERVDGLRERAGFEAKRFNLFTATTVSDVVRIGAELEFEEGGEEVKVEYAAIDVRSLATLIMWELCSSQPSMTLQARGSVPSAANAKDAHRSASGSMIAAAVRLVLVLPPIVFHWIQTTSAKASQRERIDPPV